MAFTPEQKRAHRAKPEVQAKTRTYKKAWDATNREHRVTYQRTWRAGQRAPAGALSSAGPTHTAPTPVTRTTSHDSPAEQIDLFSATYK